MLKAAAERGWLNERDAALEALMCFRRCALATGFCCGLLFSVCAQQTCKPVGIAHLPHVLCCWVQFPWQAAESSPLIGCSAVVRRLFLAGLVLI